MAVAASRTTLTSGTLLGSYRVVRVLGAGNMGVVYEAVHTMLNKRVAIKLMHADLSARQDLVERFLREGRAAVAIQHPHVVQISDVSFHQGFPYLVMDFLEGSDLRAALQARGRFPVWEACDLLLPVAAAVAAAHEAGVIHRDLKPDNIFLDQSSRRERAIVVPKVVDFGIAKLDDGGARTATQTVMGSPAYMSPEQFHGRAVPESDQWALGVILFELCTGALPFAAETQVAMMYKICVGEAQIAAAHGVVLPDALERILQRALRKPAEERFPSVRALGAALLPLCSPAARERHAHEFSAADMPPLPMAVRPELPQPPAAPIALMLSAPTEVPFTAGAPPITPLARPEPARTRRQQRRAPLLLVGGSVLVMLAGAALAWRLQGAPRSAPRRLDSVTAAPPGVSHPTQVQPATSTAPQLPVVSALPAAPALQQRPHAAKAPVGPPTSDRKPRGIKLEPNRQATVEAIQTQPRPPFLN